MGSCFVLQFGVVRIQSCGPVRFVKREIFIGTLNKSSASFEAASGSNLERDIGCSVLL